MDGLIELYRQSPDWLKLVLVIQPTLGLWGITAMILFLRPSAGEGSGRHRRARVRLIRPRAFPIDRRNPPLALMAREENGLTDGSER